MKTDRNKRSFANMTSKKRKEFTPKKQAQGNSKRHRQAELISSSDELDQSDEDEIIFVKSVEPPAGGMDCRIGSFCDRKLPCSHDLLAVKNKALAQVIVRKLCKDTITTYREKTLRRRKFWEEVTSSVSAV